MHFIKVGLEVINWEIVKFSLWLVVKSIILFFFGYSSFFSGSQWISQCLIHSSLSLVKFLKTYRCRYHFDACEAEEQSVDKSVGKHRIAMLYIDLTWAESLSPQWYDYTRKDNNSFWYFSRVKIVCCDCNLWSVNKILRGVCKLNILMRFEVSFHFFIKNHWYSWIR